MFAQPDAAKFQQALADAMTSGASPYDILLEVDHFVYARWNEHLAAGQTDAAAPFGMAWRLMASLKLEGI